MPLTVVIDGMIVVRKMQLRFVSRRSPVHDAVHDALDGVLARHRGLDEGFFAENTLVFDAVVRNLEIIGEAARQVPSHVHEGHPDIPLRSVIGMRNLIAHQYFGIDTSIIWQIVTTSIPETRRAVVSLLSIR